MKRKIVKGQLGWLARLGSAIRRFTLDFTNDKTQKFIMNNGRRI